ncbi:MAG: class III extradiol ring-cleavage dioxygenase [Hyphomonas sp.]|uniref:class III extradiol ring-cleavage dioxygenase n=1 Tax=Hyphomonas sp. TaxID=87 RepID=UPI00349FE794
MIAPIFVSHSSPTLLFDDVPARDYLGGLDHGARVALKLMYPEADIPVLQLSVQTHLGPAHHLKLGEALRPLADEGALILGSGSFTHDLCSVEWRASNAAPEWVTEFSDRVIAALAEAQIEDLLDYRTLAPFAARNHPAGEHFLPLFAALGAGGLHAAQFHPSLTFSVLRIDAFAFAG